MDLRNAKPLTKADVLDRFRRRGKWRNEARRNGRTTVEVEDRVTEKDIEDSTQRWENEKYKL